MITLMPPKRGQAGRWLKRLAIGVGVLALAGAAWAVCSFYEWADKL